MSRRPTWVGAVDFGGTGVKLALVDAAGRVVERDAFETRKAARPAAWIREVARRLGRLCKRQGLDVAALAGIGVGAPGFVDHDRGVVLTLPNVPGWDSFPLAGRLSAATGVPVQVENDVNAMALGESRLGAGRGLRHAVFLTLGTGVGGGLILNGELFRGAHGMAGELGHVPIQLDGERIPTGIGGLERFIGNQAIVAEARRRLRGRRGGRLRNSPELTVRDIAEAAREGDAVAVETFDHVARCLAAALAGVAYLLQPEAILIGGGVSQSGAVLFDPLARHMEQRLHAQFLSRLRILPAQLGADAGLIGCACLVFPTPGKSSRSRIG